MFCTNCGKELPDDGSFCVYCGKAVLEGLQQPKVQKPSEVLIPNQNSENTSQGLYSVEVNVQQPKSIILPKKKSKTSKVVIGVVIAFIVVIVVSIFSIRAYSEYNMIQQIPWTISNDDEVQSMIFTYYEDYLGKSLMLGCNAEDFSAKRGLDSNSFDFVGKIQVTDTSQDSRPTYDVNVTGTVTTNFFRTEYSLSYTLQCQVPEDKNVISMETLYRAYSSNAALADNTYANQYLNVSGTITNIRSNAYSNTVEVELGLPSELFYASFEFNSVNEEVYGLQVGDKTTLTGYLAQSGTYFITFTNASIYKRSTPSNESNPAGAANDFPPTLPPIDPNDPYADMYSDYLGLYINREGFALEIGQVTSYGEGNYYARIYKNLAAAQNHESPILEFIGGEEIYGAHAMNIWFNDGQSEVYFTRIMDDWDEENLTFDMYADPYYGGVNTSPYSQSTYYMIARGINVIT